MLPPSLDYPDIPNLAEMDERMAKFTYQYEQMLMHLTFWALTTPCHTKNNDQLPDPYVLVVKLEDLDDACPPPRFGIKVFEKCPLSKLPKSVQDDWYVAYKQGPSRMGPKFCRFEMCVVIYNNLSKLERAYISTFPFNYDADRLPHPGMNRSPTEQSFLLWVQADKYATAINDMAQGRAKSLKRATKLQTSAASKNTKGTNKNKKTKKGSNSKN